MTMQLKIVDATPPDGFPAQVIVLDRDMAQRYPDKGFYLRVAYHGGVDTVALDGELTLPGAVQAARARGYAPTHWMETAWRDASKLSVA